jgi:hypothetical protein
MKKIMPEGLYLVSKELLEADWTLEMMKQSEASIMEGTAIKYNKEWWSNISLRMLADEVSESELQEELILQSAAITKECARLDLMTPRKEVPTRRQQGEQKDATSSDDNEQTPKGGTVRKQRDTNGDPIEEQDGGMKAKKLELLPSTPANKDAKSAKKAAGAGADRARPTPVEQPLHNNNETPAKAKVTMPPPLSRAAPAKTAPTSPTPQELKNLIDFPTPQKDLPGPTVVAEKVEEVPKQSVTNLLKTVISQMGTMAADVQGQISEGMNEMEIKQEIKMQAVTNRLENY